MKEAEDSMVVSLNLLNYAKLTTGEYIQIDYSKNKSEVYQLIDKEEKGYIAKEELGIARRSRRNAIEEEIGSPNAIDRTKLVLVRCMDKFKGTASVHPFYAPLFPKRSC